MLYITDMGSALLTTAPRDQGQEIEMANLTGFAEACYDNNSVRELFDALQEGGADSTSCADWGITAEESYSAMEEALAVKISDDYSLFCEYIDPDATTAEAEFDAMSEDARISMIREVLASNR